MTARPLLTAVAAGTLLSAVWFVPSANATAEQPVNRPPAASASPRPAPGTTGPGSAVGNANTTNAKSDMTAEANAQTNVPANAKGEAASADLALAATGGVDTTPYVFGGIALLAAGGALVTGAARRSRTALRRPSA
ncbi:hypothetical protein BLA24_26505 [Streptomyces cinnamoneus]|uniref:Uncharacterized protein n=1 Tax=Streptomyces cinnamoneus TaxID=53446 RepID=A0A2G1XEI0_STRCJ|nr:cell wall protein [Streptomyces cinnamoneus]PHQ49579.1 hypothetical protein BLA24_26505 [Streptomyces cinnamoneus]PPT14702.1 cell wall protein [Streptomyces cinnamoneus]